MFRTIALIEDNQDDAETTMRGFRACETNYHFRCFRDTIEFSNDMLKKDLTPCLVILDLNLPGVDGRTFLKKLKSNPKTKGIPIVVLTTSSDEKDVRFCYDNGANIYVQKPIDFDKMKDICVSIEKCLLDVLVRKSIRFAH